MINPNMCKRVLVDVQPMSADSSYQIAFYKVRGRTYALEIHDKEPKEPGMRRMYLKFSIMTDRCYLKSEA